MIGVTEIRPTTTADFSARMTGVIFAMHLRLPFFAMLSESCSIHLDLSGRVRTACVDPQHRITFGAEFAARLTDLQLMFVLAHEVCHVAFQHHARVGTRDRYLFNVAADFAINLLLKDCFATDKALPEGILLDEAYRGLSAEQIYEHVLRDAVTANIDSDLDFDAASDGSADGCVRGVRVAIEGGEDGWRKRIAASAASAKMRGKLPASLERAVEEHLRPKVDWVTQLRQHLRYGISRDGREQYTFVPCNRRHIQAGLYLPSLVGLGAPRIAFAIDTSGSIGPAEFGAAHAEVDSIRRQFECPVYLMDCDSAVHSGQWVGPYEALPMPMGGGGTDFRPVFDHLADERIPVDVIVYLTDGYGEFGPDPGIPTIWVMTTDQRPPWGEFVQIGIDA